MNRHESKGSQYVCKLTKLPYRGKQNVTKITLCKNYFNLNTVPKIFFVSISFLSFQSGITPSQDGAIPPNTRHLYYVGLMLGQRRRRWPNIKPALFMLRTTISIVSMCRV